MNRTRLLNTHAQPLTRRDALRLFGVAAVTAGLAPLRGYAADEKKPAATAATEPPPITSSRIGENLSVIANAGGNILVMSGTDGTLLVDSGVEAMAAGTAAEIAKIASAPVALLVNTHWHFDHAGGNERLGKAGARIIAHDRCRARMASEQYIEFFDRKIPASPKVALPIVTFANEAAIHFDDEEIHLIPVAPAHTDGDLLVRLEKANVLHMGDTFFNNAYPYIDYSSEGWIGGMLEAARKGITLCDPKTQVIPGHGPLGSLEDLRRYVAFLETIYERFSKAEEAGKTLDAVLAEKPTKDFDERLGKGFFNGEQFVRFAYTGLLKHR